VAEGRTLWERLTGANKPVPVEEKFANPARVKIGGVLTLKTIDLMGLVFTVRSREEWTRQVNGNTRTFTDYRLLARPHDGEDVEILLRMIPIANPDPIAKLTHNCVALRKFFECGWDNEDERNGLLEGLNDPKGQMLFAAGTPEQKTFLRINGKEAFDCDVAILADLDGNGKVEENEVRHKKYRMWDFFCKSTLDGQIVTEFLYVHQDLDDKSFVLWLGEEIDLTKIVA